MRAKAQYRHVKANRLTNDAMTDATPRSDHGVLKALRPSHL